jgi:hypothetical protein|tara:strand:- start:2240 stop:2641 length:402 start_codon:yes stop_codon:yes gene_type:complete
MGIIVKNKKFKIDSLESKNDCSRYIDSLDLTSGKVEVIVRPYSNKNQRSVDQNNRYWHMIRQASNESGYTVNELHTIMIMEVLGMQEVTSLKGETHSVPIQTSGLTVAQFGEYMDQVESVLVSAGIYYPQPEI